MFENKTKSQLEKLRYKDEICFLLVNDHKFLIIFVFYKSRKVWNVAFMSYNLLIQSIYVLYLRLAYRSF